MVLYFQGFLQGLQLQTSWLVPVFTRGLGILCQVLLPKGKQDRKDPGKGS